MMNRYLLFLAVSAFFSTICPCHAAVIERDLVPGSGDGLLTFDTVNQREWLDVPVTLLADYPDGLDGVLAELELGGQFEGFNWANSDDVLALAESAGIDINTTAISVNLSPTDSFLDLLGVTSSSGGNTRSSFGLVNDVVEPASNQLVAATEVIPPFSHAGLTFVSFAGLTDRPRLVTGVMLYRQIPEPSSCLLIIPSVISIIGVHRLQTATH